MDRAKLRIGIGVAALAAAIAVGWANWPWRTEVHLYAVGAKDEVVAPYPCAVVGAPPFLAVEQWAPDAWGIRRVVFAARGDGVARFACSGGVTYVADVRTPASVAIDAPATMPMASRFAPRLFARDASGAELEVGRYADIDWSVEGALRADGPGSCEFPPWCGSPPAGATWVVGANVGTGRVTARFAGFSASATIGITPNPDASAPR